MCSEHSSRTNLCLDRLGTACEERIYEVIFMNVSIANATIIYAKKVQSDILYIHNSMFSYPNNLLWITFLLIFTHKPGECIFEVRGMHRRRIPIDSRQWITRAPHISELDVTITLDDSSRGQSRRVLLLQIEYWGVDTQSSPATPAVNNEIQSRQRN